MAELKFREKLLAVQKEVGAIKKDKDNPFFHSKYADINSMLEQVKPILNKHGLVVTQPLSVVEGRLGINTVIMDAESEEGISSSCVLPDISDPQKVGSAITYFRRYSLQSLLALEAEDDDANMASGKKIKSVTKVDEPPF
jgi:hypothetical protein